MKLLQIIVLILCLTMPMTHTMNNDIYQVQSDDLCKTFGIVLTVTGCAMCLAAGPLFFTENNPFTVASAALLIHGSMQMANSGFQGLDNCYK